MTDLPGRPLGATGLDVTEFSFGCAGIAGMYQECPAERAAETLEAAWLGGIRYFDTAPFYGTGLSEQRLGFFLRDKPRDQVVVSTKVGRMLTPAQHAPDNGFIGALPALVHFDYIGDAILRSVEESLARLGLNRIDILYVHDIGAFAHGAEASRHMADLLTSGIQALHRLKSEGVIRAWGLGVNETAVCEEVMAEAEPDVILLAGRYTLLDRQAEAGFLPLCTARGVPLVMGGVLNSGILATGAVAGARFNYDFASPDILSRVEGMERICREENTTLLSAALTFPLQASAVASVLIGAADPDSLRQNLSAARARVPPRVYQRCAALSLP